MSLAPAVTSSQQPQQRGGTASASSAPSASAQAAVSAAISAGADPSEASSLAMSRDERARRFGVDCGPGLDWGVTWAPGGDYCKQLTFQNVTTQNLKITYELPASRFFFMKFPEPIVLAPGVARSVSVHFRPVRAMDYADTIRVCVTAGPGGPVQDAAFLLGVSARLPRLEASLPDAVDFGVCAVAQPTVRTITISNTGGTPAYFAWTLPAPPGAAGTLPFVVSPASGVIAPFTGTQVVTLTFTPAQVRLSFTFKREISL